MKRFDKKNLSGRKNHFLRAGFFCILLAAVFLCVAFLSCPSLYKQNAQDIELSALQTASVQSESVVQQTESVPAESIRTAEPAQNIQLSENLEIPVAVKELSARRELRSCHGFALCYREEYEMSEWVAYELTKDELVKVAGRSNNFHADPSISTGSALPSDYTKSGYDRGHLAPAGDMAWSLESMQDSFLMSNMSPQVPSFNRGVWKYLEEQVRTWAAEFGAVYVVSGPVLEKPASEYKSIGKNCVSVPEYFYKALLVQKADKSIAAIGFILPNSGYSGSFYDYAVCIDAVESRTGLDFFSALDDSVENPAEDSFDISVWK